MVGSDIESSIGGMVGGAVSSGVYFFIVLIAIGILVGIGYLVHLLMAYKHRLIIYHLRANGQKQVEIKKLRVKKDKNKMIYWYIWGERDPLPPANEKSIMVDRKGRMIVEAYFDPENGYLYRELRAKKEDITEDNSIVWEEEWEKKKFFLGGREVLKGKKRTLGRWVYASDSTETLDRVSAYTTAEKLIMVEQHEKSLDELGTNWWNQYGMVTVSIMGIILLLFIGVFFYDSYATTSVKMQELALERDAEQTKAAMYLNEIILNKQIVSDNKGGLLRT